MECPPESDLVELSEGRLGADAAERLAAHLDECESCRAIVGELVRRDAPASTPSRIGRYPVRGCLGAGGMGLVYEAFDPELGRPVAIKLLRPELASSTLHEARALARLAHPNVVAVYDVGDADGRPFIAMEWVDGESLAERLSGAAPSWREVLGLFIPAGRALVAAHSAGWCHGDFKPQNVLIGRDGRVRVADFGLAAPVRDGSGGSGGPSGGTPRYLAPERRAGGPATPAADQYAFCVALRDALARAPQVPEWLAEAAGRGAAERPRDRFARMADCLDALAGPRGAGAGFAAAGILLGLGLVGAWGAWEHAAAERCSGMEARWSGAWDADVRVRAQRAFDAPAEWSAAGEAMDAFTERWVEVRRQACLAGDPLLDREMACLEGQLERARALTAVWLVADREVVAHAAEAAGELPPPAQCLAPSALRSPPPRPASAAAVAELTPSWAQVRALGSSGKPGEALAHARALMPATERATYPPLTAEARLVSGLLEFRLGDYAAARTDFEKAENEAEAAHDDALVATSQTEQSNALQRAGRLSEALARSHAADATLSRLGRPPLLEADWLDARGRILSSSEAFQRALALREPLLPANHPAIASSWKNLGSAALEEGRLAEAERCLRRALELRERALGPRHPDVATVLTELGETLRREAQLDAAAPLLERALALRTRALGEHHPDVATTLVALAALHADQGHREEAIHELIRAVEIRAGGLGSQHPATLDARARLQSLQK